ncbi:uncharacterized protein LOC109540812 isoform X5 [Dendroctonus ponderosae]|uniref:uncharacterized protein LOC109540812 isoform X5 n=1 Tax=Dendroctonus ponderosae TaxID=77166 RepID=UPI0020364649|nr:uncharacterized protein LOC109540812 isoform X5 [Dendroctonus ponderosae]
MEPTDCAALKHYQGKKARRRENPQLVTQHFTGCSNKGQILQKTSLPPDFDVNDQAVGLSATNTAAKNYGSFSNQPSRRDQLSTQNQSVQSRIAQPGTKAENAMRFMQSGLLYTLHMIREPVVDYQESSSVPRNEEITFLTLVTSFCTQAYTAAITILVMLWNLMPLVDGLIYFIRFLLDKAIDIVETEDNKDRAIKGAILFGELTIVVFIIFMIVALIFMPVYVLMARLFSKIFSILM